MKAFNAIYRYGYLYDADTNERILLAEGSPLSVTVQREDLLSVDPYNQPRPNASLEDKLAKLKRQGFTQAAVLLPKGDPLYFEVNAGVRSKKSRTLYCLFKLRLEEDLLAARKDIAKPLQLVECNCTVTACLSDNLPSFEPIYAYSLNDAYSKTYDFYFRLYGKQVTNVKLTMMEEPGQLRGFLQHRLENTADLDLFNL